ncbi:hypothetical protein BD310DRAFT_921203 [Dichomitus squalens]|uniref:Uncharacterized protein n=1 Tax=Dichomitus squalens TaxID=114155 RepID=A0A4Q9Q367_9APHY|nr:hypothetical protein BD310DRAFT_921203 [Dichomitus squalens]
MSTELQASDHAKSVPVWKAICKPRSDSFRMFIPKEVHATGRGAYRRVYAMGRKDVAPVVMFQVSNAAT